MNSRNPHALMKLVATLILRPMRHAAVASFAVVLLSCTGHAGAQTASRPEVLLKKMTLAEWLGASSLHATNEGFPC